MNILFLRPRPSPETIGLQHVMLVEPLELEVLASLVEPSDRPVIVDLILEKQPVEHFIQHEDPDVMCVTGYVTNVPAMLRYCRTAKRINSRIHTVVGGVHCEVCPHDFDDESVDFRVVRNATTVFPALLDHIRDGEEMPLGVLRSGQQLRRCELPDHDFTFPLPSRRLTQRYRRRYFYIFHDKVALLKTAFGCPFRCSFCFCREITSHKYHERPLPEVIRELSGIPEKEIYIVDDDFLVTPARVRAFIEANRSARLDKYYLLYGRADFITRHPEIMEDFHSIGLKTVIVGIESFQDTELRSYNKNIDAATNVEALRALNRLGIECYATMIISPDWSRQDFDACRDRMRSLGVKYVNLQPLTPLHGTGMRVEREDLVVPYSSFPKWDLAHVTIRPTRMSVSEFYKSIIDLYRAILFRPSCMFDHVRKHNWRMVWKVARGCALVHRQYLSKAREASSHA